MPTEETLSETREEIAAELHNAMRYTNDLFKRAAYAGLTVEVMTLKMYGAGGVIPQLSFAVKDKDGARQYGGENAARY